MPDVIEISTERGDVIHASQYRAGHLDAPVLALAHGAGAGQRSSFMTGFADAMRSRGVTVVTFDFPYMQQRRRVPDRAPVLEGAWRAVIGHLLAIGAPASSLVIGGKSMGGRMASHVLADRTSPQAGVAGLVLLGYPLHPPGRPDQPRITHLPSLATPTLVVQGSDDTFGTESEVRAAFAVVPAPVDWLVVPGGDHSFRVPRRQRAPEDVMLDVYDTVARWVRARLPGPASRPAGGGGS